MATVKQSKTRRLKMAERAEQLKNLHFPDFPAPLVWDRKQHDGFSTIPRTLPIVMQVIDHQTKGHAAGHTLFCLWARMPDHPMITIENPTTYAAEAGFSGIRATDTWRRRMKLLKELSFIDSKSGPSGDFHYVLLLNPNVGVEQLRAKGLVQDELYGRFIDRVADVGAMGEIESWKKYQAELLKRTANEGKAPPKAKKISVKKT